MVGRSLREIIARPLRGKYNSVRYRFLTLPRERARFYFYSLTGRPWIEYYRAYMDSNVRKNRNVPIDETYIASAARHLEVLKALGLKQGDRIVDIGCGVLRSAAFFIPYVGPHNYVGTDISAERIERGKCMLLEPRGIQPDSYETVVVADNSLKELEGKPPFQFAWANSVLTHMPLDDIRQLLRATRRVLKPDGQFVLTYTVAPETQQKKLKDFYYPEELIRSECEAAGYKYERLQQFKDLSELKRPDGRLIRLTKTV